MKNSISYLGDALPLEGRAASLRKEFNSSLTSSLKYLLEACVDAIPHDLFVLANEKIRLLNLDYKISGLLSGVHADLYSAIKQKDNDRVNIIISRLLEDEFQKIGGYDNISYINVSDLNDYYQPMVKKIFSADLPRTITFDVLSSEDFEKASQQIQKGFQLLKEIFPEFYKEAVDLISEVLIFNSQGLRGGSSTDLFGMIYRDRSYNVEKMTDVVDFIIHEQSHLYVHMLANNDPLVLNPEERYESPLRKEKRPLIGVYHATFVLTRIIHVLEEVLKKGVVFSKEKDYANELMNHYKVRVQVGLEVLKNHAQMSELGSELMSSASSLVAG